jgi:hypothetical protein
MKRFAIIFLFFALGLLSCNKSFLDESPSSELFVPSTLEDFQALLDNEKIMNETPTLGELCADNFYISQTTWSALNLPKEKNAYVWESDIFKGQGDIPDWNVPYRQVFYANIVLDGLPKVDVTNSNEENWKAIKGAALFARAHAFYQVAQLFAPVYSSRNATSRFGIPLRLASGIDEKSERSSLQETYDRIIADLLESTKLLAVTIPLNNNRNRPCRQAAFAMLARVYLSMSDFAHAKIYADSCLNLYSTLMDYDALPSLTSPLPFGMSNPETLYQSKFLSATSVLRGGTAKTTMIDSNLLSSYAVPNDLRRIAFFAPGTPSNLKSSYSGFNYYFTGLAIDEVFLTRAECQARMGDVTAAMKDLNTLLEKRWKKGTFTPFIASNAPDALSMILQERRKELLFRGLRWTDIRRLNETEGQKINLTRIIGTQPTYTLPAGDSRFVILIPRDVIELSKIEQNPR